METKGKGTEKKRGAKKNSGKAKEAEVGAKPSEWEAMEDDLIDTGILLFGKDKLCDIARLIGSRTCREVHRHIQWLQAKTAAGTAHNGDALYDGGVAKGLGADGGYALQLTAAEQ